ncbi:MAG TPA: class I SAM-dependent methyltransferase [Vicinamibacterales bacterium]|nr:class I SAM-dependent methyltransferase [Vicinamibacterales bacterium]
MGKRFSVLMRLLTLGREGQSFVGAQWVAALLRSAPRKHKRRLALWVLSWSPHYFYRSTAPGSAPLSEREFTEREFERNKSTREKIAAGILAPHLNPVHVALDYGCGPGFLANSVSRRVGAVYGIDVSQGVLECARILNATPNVTFLHTTQLADVADRSIDIAYSFAVFQHLTDEVLVTVLAALHDKLKDGGKLIVHVVLDDDAWKMEEQWRQDTSLKGRVKWKVGLNCFSRNEQAFRAMLEAAGFSSIVTQPIQALCPERFDDICTQHLVCAVK